MNKSVLIVHGFGPKEDDFQLISTLQSLRYNVEYFDWFNWNSEFNIEDFNTNIKSYLDENNPKLVIGISMGGMIVSRYIELFNKIPIILIASSPIFNPNILIKIIFKLPKPILVFSINVLKVLLRIFKIFIWNTQASNNINVIIRLKTKYLITLINYINLENNTEILAKYSGDILAINGQKDFLMPPGNWNMFNVKKIAVEKAYHHNVVNRNILKIIENYITAI